VAARRIQIRVTGRKGEGAGHLTAVPRLSVNGFREAAGSGDR
jgi:hypothetical protein